MTLYIVWQVAYLIKTEIMDAKKFRDDPELVTSLRWISMHTKNRKNAWTLKQFRKIGFWSRRRVLPGQHKNQICVRLHAIHLHYDNLRRTTACYVNFYVHTFIILLCFSFYALERRDVLHRDFQQSIPTVHLRRRGKGKNNTNELRRLSFRRRRRRTAAAAKALDDLDRILKHPR